MPQPISTSAAPPMWLLHLSAWLVFKTCTASLLKQEGRLGRHISLNTVCMRTARCRSCPAVVHAAQHGRLAALDRSSWGVQALRVAYDSLSRQGSFEAVLREADSAEALMRSRQTSAAPLLDITLLHQPKVFTLALVWESAKVSRIDSVAPAEQHEDVAVCKAGQKPHLCCWREF